MANVSKITIGTELDTKSFDAQIEALQRDLTAMEKAYETGLQIAKPEDIEDMQKLEVEIEKTKNKIVSLNKQKEKLGQTQGPDAFGNSLRKAVGQAGRLALAIFGIRSAYLAVRQASSNLATYDKQYAANLEYIKYALTQVIAPVLQWIVSLAAKVLQIINTIVGALFGINLFSNASAKSFQKMKAGAGGTAKAVKEIKKQLAGFDEMNILQDNTEQASGGGGGGAVAPSFDLSNLENAFDFDAFAWKVDEFLATLDDKFVVGFTKIGENIKKVLRDLGFSELFISMFDVAFHGVQDIISGFIKVVRGVLDIILGFVNGDTELVKQGFDTLIKGLGQMLTGFIEFAMGIIGMIVATVIGWLQDIWNWFNNTIIQPVWNFIKDLLAKAKQMLSDVWNAVKEKFTQIKTFVTGVINNIISLFKIVGTKVGNAIGGSFKAVVNTILGAVENILNKPIQAINGMIDKINTLPGVNVGWHLDEFHLPRLEVGGIVNMPGRGVMVGSAIAGERGAEGVIPLTDAQAMETLGAAIGRYITINANITNSMNGKVLSRELKRINNEQDFAYNT